MAAKIHRIASLAPDVDRVWHAAVHPTAPLLAAACGDKTVRIYSLRTYAHLSSIEGGHKRSVRSVAWKPGSESEAVLATASFDSTVGIWRGAALNSESRKVLRQNNQDHDGEELQQQQQQQDGTNQGEQAGGEEEEEEEEEDWRFAVVLDGHDSEVKGVAWSAGGSLLATCSRDKSVWVWEEMDEDNFETIAVLQDHSQDVKAVCWHPDGEVLASASYDDTIRLYREDIDDWMCYAVLTGHDSTVWSICFENAGEDSRLVSSSDDLTVRVWSRCKEDDNDASKRGTADVSIIKSAHGGSEKWEPEAVLPKMHERAVYSTSWSPISGRIASVGGDGKLIVYEEEKNGDGNEEQSSSEGDGQGGDKQNHWKVIAQLEGIHGAQEANSVLWARRWDKEGASEKDEILITTGDDGNINIYEIISQ